MYINLPCKNVKCMKDRLSILFCAIMDRSDKIKPLIIGKSENPRLFSSINRNNPPVCYTNNKTSWMKEEILSQWLHAFRRGLRGVASWHLPDLFFLLYRFFFSTCV